MWRASTVYGIWTGTPLLRTYRGLGPIGDLRPGRIGRQEDVFDLASINKTRTVDTRLDRIIRVSGRSVARLRLSPPSINQELARIAFAYLQREEWQGASSVGVELFRLACALAIFGDWLPSTCKRLHNKTRSARRRPAKAKSANTRGRGNLGSIFKT